MPRLFVIALLVVVATTISGCSRRNRVDAPPSPTRQPQLQKLETPVVILSGTQAALPEESIPLPLSTAHEAGADPTTDTAAVPLDPLWDELDDALDGLDAALAGIEAWEVDVP